MDYYYFYEQYKDYFKILNIIRIDYILFISLFFCNIISFK